MPSRPLFRILQVALVPTALFLCLGTAGAQPRPNSDEPFGTGSSAWDGYSEFVRIAQHRLGSRRVKLTKTLNYEELRPGDAVLIVHPTESLDDASLSAFLADGGRVGLLDDYGQGASLLRKFDIHRKPAPADPARRLRSNPSLAIAIPTVQMTAGAERGRHPMTERVQEVVTNHPIALDHPDLTPVLEIPDTSGSSATLAVTGVIANHGRLFALGDPSVFINLMMRYRGNRQLAEGLIHYLLARAPLKGESLGTADGPPGRPAHLYVVVNQFDQQGRYGEKESFWQQLRKKLEEATQAARSIHEEGMPPGLALLFAGVVGLWLFSSQLRSHIRIPQLKDFSFTRPHLLSSQAGLGARALVLSAPRANPILALLELDAALRESLTQRLGLNGGSPGASLAEQAKAHGLSHDDARCLAALFATLRSYGERLTVGKSKKPTEDELKRLHHESMRLLSEVERLGRKS